MSGENSDVPSNLPRASRFREHTNTSNSIRPPPDELWKDLGIDSLIDKFNAENDAPAATARKSNGTTAPELRRLHSDKIKKLKESTAAVSGEGGQPAASSGQAVGALGRFQRAWASMIGGVLGKRKAGAVDAEKDKAQQLLDDRKKAAEAAYHEAKELGLLPTPKVFVRPAMAATATHTCTTPLRAPRTPSLYRSPSKKDLQKQKKLSKRVSNLECKLASARKELDSVLNNDFQPVLPLSALVHYDSHDAYDTHDSAHPLEPTRSPPPRLVSEPPSDSDLDPDTETEARPFTRRLGRINKKRKARVSPDDADADYVPAATDSEADIDMLSAPSEPEPEPEKDESSIPLDHERTVKRVKSSASSMSSTRKKSARRPTTRLQKRGSRTSLGIDDVAVTVVPDGVSVPLVPALPGSVSARGGVACKQETDLYGGLEHEMF